jgi:stage V sporulation protein D (sporulation-specific penicillin-binding protein)
MTSRKKHARVYVVGILFVIVAGALWARLIEVQYFQRQHYRSLADGQIITSEDIPPVRGSIYDRQGRPLALSVRLASVYLQPEEVTNPKRVASKVAAELGLTKREVRKCLRSKKKFLWLARKRNLSHGSVETLGALDGVGIQLEQGRVYPYGATAAKVVGFVGVDNCGMAGVEAAFEDQLRGVPGLAKVVRNGEYHKDRYYRFVEKQPRDGKHIYLTIDAVIQEIAENRLEKAVATHGASSGAIIVMKANTGEILALAEYPSPKSRSMSQRRDALWTIRSVSHVYEPGSTFKLVTAAALLDSHRIEPSDMFDAENGRAHVGGVAWIKDPHPHGVISFEDAFAYSSNIVMYKASARIDEHAFYRYIRLFGFGEKTGIEMAGESAGSVAEVDDWSLRTRGTIAFGQEIAVTPLQMIGAYAVVANDGEMVLPRLLCGVVDETTGKATPARPVKVRRVVSRATSRLLQKFCLRTVVDGTGESAAVDFMRVAGKTGTAQKAAPGGGYLPGKYVSSFVGIAPQENPRIVCLVLLDEPRYASRYGGESCAPVFAGLCHEIANATDVFNGVLASTMIPPPAEETADYIAPNFIRMERAAALESARRLGCNVLCQGDAGRVVEQNPSPGVPMDRDAVIRLVVADGYSTKAKTVIPDLRGMPVREAKAMAVRHGIRCTLVGSGVVTSQKPAPGHRAGRQRLKLYCDATGNMGSGGSP